MIYVQITLLVILITIEVYVWRMQREIARRLDNLLEEHGEVPVEQPDPMRHVREVHDGVRRLVSARKRA